MAASIPIRVLMAKIGLDGHDRGVKVVARAYRDAGFEVVYTGLHRSPEQVVSMAVDEDVDVVGVSILSGAQMTIFPRLLELLRDAELDDVLLLGGGTFPPDDVAALEGMGIDKVFAIDTPLGEIVDFTRANVRVPDPLILMAVIDHAVEEWPPQHSEAPADPSSRYWSGEETMSFDERQALVLQRLRHQLEYVWTASAFYRRHWSEHGISPAVLETLDDLSRFPVVTKDDIRRDQEEFPPFGSNLCCDPSEIARFHGTSGTTGRPLLFAISQQDWKAIGAAHARIMWGFGVRPDDTIFIGSLFSLYIGSWGALAGAEHLGATVFPFGAGLAGQTERAISYLQLIRPTVFYGTPSYALHIARTAEALDIDPRSFGFRVLFFSGEPGAGIGATKDRIERLYGGICVDTGSMAEMTPWMANAECEQRNGMHLWDDIVYTEIVGVDDQLPLAGDGEGVPVYTHLWRTSQPMIRLYSGDLTSVTSEPCECGRSYRRLPRGIYGRVDDMLIVRGVNLYPHVIEDVLGGVAGLGFEYRIVVDRPQDLDTFSIEIEASRGDVAETVAERVKNAVGLRPHVKVVPPGTLQTSEFKSRRVIDRRNGSSEEGNG